MILESGNGEFLALKVGEGGGGGNMGLDPILLKTVDVRKLARRSHIEESLRSHKFAKELSQKAVE